MSAGGIAALTAAGAFVLLVALLAGPLIKLGRALDAATMAIKSTHEGAVPILAQAQAVLDGVNSRLAELEHISEDVNSITTSVAALTAAVANTVGRPLLKVASVTYALRSVLHRRGVVAQHPLRRSSATLVPVAPGEAPRALGTGR